MSVTSAASPHFPPRINFPPNPNTGGVWGAEGIFGKGHTFWAGDTTNGAILKGDVRTGESSILVPAAAQGAKSAFGVFVDHWNRLWVAGGSAPTGLTERHAFVYDADTGALIKDILLATGPFPAGSAYGIINDVTVTKDAAYFTNTNNATNPGANVLFKVPLGKHGEIGSPTTVPIPFFGANGIEATKNGNTLIIAGFTTGELYKLDTETNEVTKITLDGPLPRPDGLILKGQKVYAVLNVPILPPATMPPTPVPPAPCGDIAVIELSDHMTSGEIVDHLNNPDDPLVNPATADIFGKYIYVIRRNGIVYPDGTCTTRDAAGNPLPVDRWLTRVDKHGEDED